MKNFVIYLHKDHVDECDEDGWRAPLCGEGVTLEAPGNVGSPLVYHQQRHITEHKGEEHKLRYKLTDDVHFLVKVFTV